MFGCLIGLSGHESFAQAIPVTPHDLLPEQNIKVIGTPQFEPYVIDRYKVDKETFFNKFELDSSKRITPRSALDSDFMAIDLPKPVKQILMPKIYENDNDKGKGKGTFTLSLH